MKKVIKWVRWLNLVGAVINLSLGLLYLQPALVASGTFFLLFALVICPVLTGLCR